MLSETMPNEIAEGRVLAGKYRVERVLGQGGMGVVVAAHHIQLDERVAIKFLLPDAVANAEVVGRFVREARAAVRIKSEHVARVSDVGTLEGGEPYMVMEYLEGSDLAAWLLQRGALPVEQAVEFLLQASEAIAEAHALGIVHRDLKPANLFVVRRADGLWSVKVLDFGISKVTALDASGPDANFTRTSAVMGSPLYMPPEQMAASRNVDARADIWALGVILYELLSGHAPFAGETLPEVCMKIAIEPPPAIRSLQYVPIARDRQPARRESARAGSLHPAVHAVLRR
jgi:serine/threonine-protein kinase